jgi:hypothetical protein
LPATFSQKALFEFFFSLLKARFKNLPAAVPSSPKTLFKFSLDDCPLVNIQKFASREPDKCAIFAAIFAG